MKKLASFIGFCFVLLSGLLAQSGSDVLQGVVSFTTSQNVYVRFAQTDKIAIGDSLYLEGATEACLLITTKSSTSCVCKPINDCLPAKGSAVIYRLRPQEEVEPVAPVVQEQTPVEEPTTTVEPEEDKTRQKIRGRITLSTYNNIGSDRPNRNRVMGRLSLGVTNIAESNFSLQTDMNYRYIVAEEPERVQVPLQYLRVFNLAVSYAPRPDLSLTLGRRINQKIASLGAIDGLQAEKHFGNTYIGAVVGSRPDISTFALNFNLLQFGGYVGYENRS
ncbi:MAG: hypothetical protein AAFQ87_09245, partial [Bacteroidota bacterium]